MLKLFWSVIFRYGIVALISILAYNQLTDYPPLVWLDKDKRQISKLQNENNILKKYNGELIVEKVDLENKVILQNKAISDLEREGKRKEAKSSALSKVFKEQLEDLENKIDKEDPDINSCQDAIDYLIGIEK